MTDLVRSFTGGFTEQSMKATPGGADAGDYRRPDDDQRPITRGTPI